MPDFIEVTPLRKNPIVVVALPLTVAGAAIGGYAVSRGPLGAAALAAIGVGVTLGLALFVWVFGFGGLYVEVDGSSVRYRFRPLTRVRTIAAAEIQDVEAVTYRPIRDFGGWGIRRGRGGVTAYTIRGNRGVKITRAGDRPVLLGSDRADELAAAVEAIRE